MKIGILGAGQLGRMLALAGYPLGASFSFYDNAASSCCAGLGQLFGRVAQHHNPSQAEVKLSASRPQGNLLHSLGNTAQAISSIEPGVETEALQAFIDSADLFTYEFEHLDLNLVSYIAEQKPVYPPIEALRISQNRWQEKNFFRQHDIPTPDFIRLDSQQDLTRAEAQLGLPMVIKTTTNGYDGKGQWLIRSQQDLQQPLPIGQLELIAEAFVHFKRELSIIGVRSQSGELVFYPLTENLHRDGILAFSTAPAPGVSPAIQQQAEDYAKTLMQATQYVGVMTLELFETEAGLVANEIAPRVHNSGHWTQNANLISQFENHLRAISGLPLGATHTNQQHRMINLLGHFDQWQAVLAEPQCYLHWYGKEMREKRKIGHINICTDNSHSLEEKTAKLLTRLPIKPPAQP